VAVRRSTAERGKELWTCVRQSFARIAEDIGALGIRVEKPAEIGTAL
jgi:thiamine pyrophosphate-dependent acetolactate synthase large subunit-like protein